MPVAVWKAIYIPKLNQSGVYYGEHKEPDNCYIISQLFFTKQTGIDPFLNLDDAIKDQKADLPKPKK